MEQIRKPFSLEKLKQMTDMDIIHNCCYELNHEEFQYYLENRPDFQQTFKAINNEHVLKESPQDFQNALNEWMDKLYKAGELPSQVGWCVTFIADRVVWGVHWMGNGKIMRHRLNKMLRAANIPAAPHKVRFVVPNVALS